VKEIVSISRQHQQQRRSTIYLPSVRRRYLLEMDHTASGRRDVFQSYVIVVAEIRLATLNFSSSLLTVSDERVG